MRPVQLPVTAGNPAIFPSFVAQYSVTFGPDDVSDLGRYFPGITVPESLSRSAPARRAEYCAGRYCAMRALGECSQEHAGMIIPSGARGEPLWPPGIVGAITHTRNFASAAVARASQTRGIGLDSEMVREDELGDIAGYIAAPDEIAALVHSTGWSAGAVTQVVFSAKETIFKCLYPEVGRYFDFRDATVEGICVRTMGFSARLLVPLTRHLIAGTRLEGRFERRGDLVSTAIVLGPSSQATTQGCVIS